MGRQMPGRLGSSLSVKGFVLLCLLCVSGAKTETTCKRGCPQSDNGLLKLTPGNVYEYSFDSVMTVGLNGAADDKAGETGLKVVGNAKLFAEGNCGYTLQLGAVKVTATREAIEKKITQSIQKPVHFTMVGGKLEPQLCADANDHSYALNIKRALISLFQTKAKDSEHEVDVFGQCPTHTSVSKVGQYDVVTKVRNLNGCAYRGVLNSGFLTDAVSSRGDLKATSLLQADYSKETKLEGGVPVAVHLVEEYKYEAMARSEAGIRAKVVTNLKVKNPAGSAAAPPPTANHGVSIIFQQPETYPAKNGAALNKALADLVRRLDGYVRKDSAKGFVDFIRLLRHSDTETLLELAELREHPNKQLARRIYLDGLFRTASAESARAIIKQFAKMDDKEKALAILSLNLVQTVDKETLNVATTLLNPSAMKEAYLAVGHLVDKFCQRHKCANGEIEAVSKRFADSLKHCKANTKKDEERLLYVLKGIGNAGHLAATVAPVLGECSASGRSNRIRVAALQAFSAASCNPELQKKALDLLSDRNEDSELRIEAYLAAISCPGAEVANQIAELVNTETVNQVGGFIVSSLKAIRDSTDEGRETQRKHFANIRVTKHFPRDPRRYSFNNELSYKLDSLGLSASADYKLIYSQHGFLPRSARLNVKAQEFGVNMNLMEASVRQENMEHILEYFLGPKGLINKDFDEILKSDEEGARSRRSIADEANKVAKKYKVYGAKNVNDLNLDLSLKFFGSEMMFLSLGDNIPNTFDEVTKQFSEALDKVKKELAAYNKQFASHDIFLDSEAIYPTGVGIPLEVSFQGFGATKLDFGVSLDVDALLENLWPFSGKYRLKVVPSFDLNLDMKVTFDGYVLATGLCSDFGLHSATGGDLNLAISADGNSYNLDVQLPRDKIELLDLQAESHYFVAEQDKPTQRIALRDANARKARPQSSEMCYSQLESLGLTPCFASNLIDLKPGEDLNFVLFVNVERNINLKLQQLGAEEKRFEWKLDYSTPGSRQPHDTSLAVQLATSPHLRGRLSLDNARYHFAVEAGLQDDSHELVAYSKYERDSYAKHSKLGFRKSGNEYRPFIEIREGAGVSNELNGYRVDGRVLLVRDKDDKQSRYNFENLQLIHKDSERIVLINGWADVAPMSLAAELHVAPGRRDSFLVRGHAQLADGHYKAGLFLNEQRTPDKVYGASAGVKVNDQQLDVELVAKFSKWQATLSNDVRFVKKEQSSALLAAASSSKFDGQVAVRHADQMIGSLQVRGSTEGPDKFEVEVDAVSGKRSASLSVKFAANQRAEKDYQLALSCKLDGHFVDLTAKCDVSGSRFVVDNTLTTSWGTLLTLQGELGQRYTLQDVHVDLHGSAQLSGSDKPTQWLLKVIGVAEKTNAELRVSRDSGELLRVVADTQHPQDRVTAAKVNVVAKGVLTAKADLKVAKSGKGELSASVETLRTEPKHKLELNSKFHIQSPKCDVEATLLVDAAKKLYLKTENVLEKLKVSTKNVLEAASGRQVAFDASGSVKGDWRWNGELQGDFALSCWDGRRLEGWLKRKVTSNAKTGIAQGTLEAQLSEQLAASSKKRSAFLSGRLERLHLKSRDLVADAELLYSDFADRKVALKSHIRKQPKGANKMLDFGATLSGDLVPAASELALLVDEYSAKHAVYRLTATHGDRVKVNVKGNCQSGASGAPAKYELQATVEAPQSTLKSLEVVSSGKYLRPHLQEGGNYLLEFSLDERSGSDQFAKLNVVWRGSTATGGGYNVELETQQMQGPLKVDGSYHYESAEGGVAGSKQRYAFNYAYGDKYVKAASELSYADVGAVADSLTARYTLATSFEAAKSTALELRLHKPDPDSHSLSLQAEQNGRSYSADLKLHRGPHKKGVELHANRAGSETTPPPPPPLEVVALLELLGPNKAKLTLTVDRVADLDLKAKAELAYKTVEDFYVVAQWQSAKLRLEGYELELRAEGNTLTIHLKEAGGVVLAGRASYAHKKEPNKSIVEGQGQVQYRGRTHNSNFRLIRQRYEMASDKEFGFSYTFDGNFGPKNGVSTLKVTNKDFNVKLSVCEEKKQCTNVQLQAMTAPLDGDGDADEQPDTLAGAQHSLLVLVDLRELGYPYEFELQSKTVRRGLSFRYSLDSSIVSNNNMKYELLAQVVPGSAKLQLKLPSRELAVEAEQQAPPNGQLFGHYEHSLSIYVDRTNKPNDVTQLLAQLDIGGVERVALNAKATLRFAHPTIRPLSVTATVDAHRDRRLLNSELVLDIFKLPEQQLLAAAQIQDTLPAHGFNITVSQTLRSSGLALQYELQGHAALNAAAGQFSAGCELSSPQHDLKAGGFVWGNREGVEVVVGGFGEQVLHLVAHFDRQKYSSRIDTKLQLLGQTPVEVAAELQPSQASVSVKRQGLLHADGQLRLGKELKFLVEGGGKELFNGRIGLEPNNFLQTTYTSSADDVKAFLDIAERELQRESEQSRDQIRQRFAKLRHNVEQQVQLWRASVPDFGQLQTSYQSTLNDIVKELESDPAMKQISKSFQKLYRRYAAIADELAKLWSKTFERLHVTLAALHERYELVLKDSVLPAWEQCTLTANKLMRELRIHALNLCTKTLQTALEMLKDYEPALRSYGKALAEAWKPLQQIVQQLNKLAYNAEDLLKKCFDYWTQLPTTFESIRAELAEKLQQFKFAERALDLVNALFEQLHLLPLTAELNEFLAHAQKYVAAKLKQQQPIDDEPLIAELIKLFVKAVRSLYVSLEMAAPTLSGYSLSELFTSGPAASDWLELVPALFSFRFSFFNYLLNEEWTRELLAADRWLPSSLSFFFFFADFDLKGQVVEGRHVFTFDGLHYSFHGNCRYILAQDSVDNNFTVVAHLNNGKMKAILLADRDGKYLELNDAGVLKLNGNAVEWPQHEEGMHAWRRFYTVWLHSEYGVEVMCTSDLRMCHVAVDGFYMSKVRGLLGNGNAEPYDDFVQIDGTRADDYAAFVSGYGLGKCNPVARDQPTDSDTAHTDLCNQLFGLESPLAVGYLFLNSKPYRAACDQAVSAAAAEKDKDSAACSIALAYGSALKMKDVYVMLPKRCLKCAGAAGQRELGDEFTVKLPGPKADVVFVIDVDLAPSVMKGLVAPAVNEIRETLKGRGFSDIQVGVVAYSGNQRYPALLTSNGGKLNYQGNMAEVKLSGPKHIFENNVSQMITEKRVLDIFEMLEELLKGIVPQSDETAFRLALDYPFRAAAAKTIIGVRSNTLEYGNLLKFARAHLMGAFTQFHGALLHEIAPVNELALEGVAAEKLVGFNSRLVATLEGKDAKKRPKLRFQNNMGIDFVLNNGGWVFATQNFDQLKPQDQKKFLNQVTNSIADTLFKTEIVSECRCLPLHGLHAQHKCVIKSSSFVPSKKVKA